MLDWGSFVVVAAVALAVGVLIGSAGVGGVLLIPVLVYPGGLTVHQAAATALASFFFTGCVGAVLHARRGGLKWRLAWPVCAGALVATYLGALLAAQLAQRPLAIVIGGIIIAAGILILRPGFVLGVTAGRSAQREIGLLVGIGLVAGFGSGLSGAGGPVFASPLMIVLGFAPLAAVGVGQALQIVAAVAGSIANLQSGAIEAGMLTLIVVFQLLGLSTGVRLAHSLPSASLRQLAAWLCLVAGCAMVLRFL